MRSNRNDFFGIFKTYSVERIGSVVPVNHLGYVQGPWRALMASRVTDPFAIKCSGSQEMASIIFLELLCYCLCQRLQRSPFCLWMEVQFMAPCLAPSPTTTLWRLTISVSQNLHYIQLAREGLYEIRCHFQHEFCCKLERRLQHLMLL